MGPAQTQQPAHEAHDRAAGRVGEAVPAQERAISLAEGFDETKTLFHALNNVGHARLWTGDERGREQLERSLHLAREAGLEEHVGRALTNLGWNAVHEDGQVVCKYASCCDDGTVC
jgi:hypothetical protein